MVQLPSNKGHRRHNLLIWLNFTQVRVASDELDNKLKQPIAGFRDLLRSPESSGSDMFGVLPEEES